jgi:hypothetical protein
MVAGIGLKALKNLAGRMGKPKKGAPAGKPRRVASLRRKKTTRKKA